MNGTRQLLKKFSPDTHLILLGLLLVPLIIQGITPAYAQSSINATSSTPCFLNYNQTGLEMMQSCGLGTDYLSAVTLGFDWVTGGLFPMILITILIVMVYLKYHNALLSLAIGIIYLPIGGYFFPDQFISVAMIFAGITVAGTMFIMVIKRTKDF